MQTSRPKGSFPREEMIRIVEELGYECVGIQQTKENDRRVLRVFIDSLGGINIKDCEMVSRKISSMMDTLEEESPGEGLPSYLLEISSPGVERPLFTLQDYSRFLGKKVHLFLKEGESLEGVLQSVDTQEGAISLMPEGEEEPRVFPFESIEKGHLVFEFEVKQHAHKPKSGESKKKKKKKKKRKP